MAINFGSKIEGTAYAVLNEIFGVFRGKGGFARPSRYEVILNPPAGTNANLVSSQIQEFRGDDTVRQTSLACENISFPGRNIDTTEDTNIYGPTRQIATGFSYAEVELVEAFPKTIGAQTLDYSSTGEIHKLPVTFSYRWWKSLADEANLPQPIEDRINQILGSAIERQLTANIPKVLSKLGL